MLAACIAWVALAAVVYGVSMASFGAGYGAGARDGKAQGRREEAMRRRHERERRQVAGAYDGQGWSRRERPPRVWH